MKRSLISYAFAIFSLVILCGTTVYAWWISGFTTTKITIVSANVDSECELYKGIDFNYDGLLDLTNGNDTFTNKLEEKIFDFNEVAVNGSVTERSLNPSEIHTWKVNIINKGDAIGLVSMKLIAEDSTFISYLNYFSISIDDGEKIYLADLIADGSDMTFYNEGDMIYPSYMASADKPSSRSYIIRIEFETIDSLIENGYTVDYNTYQELQAKVIDSQLFLDVVLSTEK